MELDILIVLNIIILEVLLSIDNAAVLASMVKTLPKKQQPRALTYGIAGAYIFRGLALVFAYYLIKIMWLKVLGGLYLIYLAYTSLKNIDGNDNIKPIKFKFLSPFWSTVIAIEFADIVFSIDNVFAAVAFTDNLYLICGGVAIGIIAMRYAATLFVKVIYKYPVLEKVSFWVVGALGIKLISSYWLHELNTELIDFVFSILVLSSFIIPVLYAKYSRK